MTETTHANATLVRSDYVVIGGGAAAVVTAGVAHFGHWPTVLSFALSAMAVTLLAALVGRSVEQLGDRFGPGATGVLQSGLGNLPELFISLFALKAGLVGVVKAALIGSILANLLLVLGLAFVVGGLKHGTQRIDSERARTIAPLMILSVTGLVLPSVAHYVHAPAASHEQTLSLIASVVLIVIFVCSLPAALRKSDNAPAMAHEPPRWPVALAVGLLASAGLLAAFVSDWFVQALEPAMATLNISDTFAGLVIVAIAGNAIENVVGVQLAAKNQAEYAFSVIINSPLQIALVLAPALVILSQLFGFATLTLVFSPLLVVAVTLAVIIAIVITIDGESSWLEGAALIGVYVVIASTFWWG
ncbi:MAG: calcium/proton exchanger [Nocardioidaceae bacterium]